MRSHRVQMLTECALLIAISVCLFFAAFLPLMGIFIAPFSPMPLTLAVRKHGFRTGLFACFVSLCLCFVFGVLYGLAFVPFVWAGVLLGGAARLNLSGPRTMAVGVVGLAVLLLGLYYPVNGYLAKSPTLPSIEEMIDRSFATMTLQVKEAMRSTFGVNDAEIQKQSRLHEVLAQIETFRLLSRKIFEFPVAFFVCLAAIAFGIYFALARWFLSRLHVELPDMPPLREWKLPWTFSWPLIALLAFHAAVRHYEHPFGTLVSYNFIGIFLALYLSIGLAIVEHTLHRFRADALAKTFVYLVLLQVVVFAAALPYFALVGVLDSWFDFRGLERAATPDGSSPGGDDDDEDDEEEEDEDQFIIADFGEPMLAV